MQKVIDIAIKVTFWAIGGIIAFGVGWYIKGRRDAGKAVVAEEVAKKDKVQVI